MMNNNSILILLWLTMPLFFHNCQGQSNQSVEHATHHVGGSCEGCEAIYEFGARSLHSIDTLPGFLENKPKLKIEGRVLAEDGSTPVPNVIVYIYHTNRKGLYATKGEEKGWAKKHGHIRGWIKTRDDGQFAFYTFRPAAYPDGREPEHIHIIIKESDKNEYYIDSYVFEDDPLLTSDIKKNLENRGGSGIVKPMAQEDHIFLINRDIILGKNIPDYD